MIVDGIDAQADDLDIALVKFGFDSRHVTELRRAYRREVLGMRKQHCPGIADPVMETDAALGRFRFKIRSDVVDFARSCRTTMRRVALICGPCRILQVRNMYSRRKFRIRTYVGTLSGGS